MSIRNQIQSQIITSMKSHDQKRLDAFRFLFSQIRYREIDAKRELTDEETVKLLQGEAKKRREVITAYKQGGRQDLADKEQYELSVIEEFLPKQLTDEEIKAIITEVKAANSNGDFGALMKTVMVKVAGRAEGAKVAGMIKQKG
ncbi:GatB/YqeY domain-containing protein [Candidatus Collierbacteria bacterium]|nr:GatB/YqeY domain-containing protein [Candidatus Collierbacteria bacterium]